MFDLYTIRHLAELSMLCFDDEETKRLAIEMEEIKDLMDKVKGQETLPYSGPIAPIRYKLLRTDRALKSLDKEIVLANAKKTKNFGFFVPKIV